MAAQHGCVDHPHRQSFGSGVFGEPARFLAQFAHFLVDGCLRQIRRGRDRKGVIPALRRKDPCPAGRLVGNTGKVVGGNVGREDLT